MSSAVRNDHRPLLAHCMLTGPQSMDHTRPPDAAAPASSADVDSPDRVPSSPITA